MATNEQLEYLNNILDLQTMDRPWNTLLNKSFFNNVPSEAKQLINEKRISLGFEPFPVPDLGKERLDVVPFIEPLFEKKELNLTNIETILKSAPNDSLNDIKSDIVKNTINDLFLKGKINKDKFVEFNSMLKAKENRVANTNAKVSYQKVKDPEFIKQRYL